MMTTALDVGAKECAPVPDKEECSADDRLKLWHREKFNSALGIVLVGSSTNTALMDREEYNARIAACEGKGMGEVGKNRYYRWRNEYSIIEDGGGRKLMRDQRQVSCTDTVFADLLSLHHDEDDHREFEESINKLRKRFVGKVKGKYDNIVDEVAHLFIQTCPCCNIEMLRNFVHHAVADVSVGDEIVDADGDNAAAAAAAELLEDNINNNKEGTKEEDDGDDVDAPSNDNDDVDKLQAVSISINLLERVC